MQDPAKINDALDAVIDMVFSQTVFNTGLEDTEEQKNELRFAILTKFDEMGVKLINVGDG